MVDNIFSPNQKTDGYYTRDREEMLKFIPRTSSKILDVGCGSGSFGAILKSQKDVEVWGVEISEDAAKEAVTRIDRIIIGDIESEELGLPLNYFDCIILNDVLEHLLYPWNVLVKFKTYLQNGGYIIASIPNVRYYPNIRDLIVRKNWEYKDEGILDKTHLRFFTERTIKKMFVICGYANITIKGINEKQFSWKLKILNYLLRHSLDDMKYLQFAVVAQKINMGEEN